MAGARVLVVAAYGSASNLLVKFSAASPPGSTPADESTPLLSPR
jgi:hypothetical protein